jgi:hypothetical protein
MGTQRIIQKILDDTLISRGILSNHIRRVEATTAKDAKGKFVKINPDIYLVYRVLLTRSGHGDGKPITKSRLLTSTFITLTTKPTPATQPWKKS